MHAIHFAKLRGLTVHVRLNFRRRRQHDCAVELQYLVAFALKWRDLETICDDHLCCWALELGQQGVVLCLVEVLEGLDGHDSGIFVAAKVVYCGLDPRKS
jgi:hypothetical protein